MNMKFTRTLLMLALTAVIGLSVTGGTIAWFTDSVSSAGNVIQAGTLNMKVYAVDTKDYTANYTYDATQEVKDGSAALFSYDLWEPGYTSSKNVKIVNDGSLAFKYHVNVKPAMNASYTTNEAMLKDFKLAEAIEVYMVPAKDYQSFADIKAAYVAAHAENPVPPTLMELAIASITGADPDGIAWGNLLANQSVEHTLALHMKESAGNEYKGLSVGDGFVIELRAEQLAHETDSFNSSDYDEEATVSDAPVAFYAPFSQTELGNVELVAYDPNTATTVRLNPQPDLDVGYMFASTDSPKAGIESPYAKWHADFAVSFDKDVEPNQVGFAGSHSKWGSANSWLAFALNEEMIKTVTKTDATLPAGTPIRLLQEAGMTVVPDSAKPTFSVNYEELCKDVFQLLCGAYVIDPSIAGTTMTVELRLYEVEDKASSSNNSWNNETTNYITLNTFTHKF